MPFTLPENCKIVQIAATAAANGATYNTISCKNAHKVWFIVQHQGTNDTDITLSLIESSDVADGTTTAVTATFPIWKDTNVGTASDTLVRQTDAASHQINTGVTTNQLVIIEWDPAKFSAGYDCIKMADAGGDGSNFVTVVAIIQTRYPGDQPPTVIAD